MNFLGLKLGKSRDNYYENKYKILSGIYDGHTVKELKSNLANIKLGAAKLLHEPNRNKLPNEAIADVKLAKANLTVLNESVEIMIKQLRKISDYKYTKKIDGQFAVSETVSVKADADTLRNMLIELKNKQLVVLNSQMETMTNLVLKYSEQTYGPSTKDKITEDMNKLMDSEEGASDAVNFIEGKFAEVKEKVDSWGLKKDTAIYGPGKA